MDMRSQQLKRLISLGRDWFQAALGSLDVGVAAGLWLGRFGRVPKHRPAHGVGGNSVPTTNPDVPEEAEYDPSILDRTLENNRLVESMIRTRGGKRTAACPVANGRQPAIGARDAEVDAGARAQGAGIVGRRACPVARPIGNGAA